MVVVVDGAGFVRKDLRAHRSASTNCLLTADRGHTGSKQLILSAFSVVSYPWINDEVRCNLGFRARTTEAAFSHHLLIAGSEVEEGRVTHFCVWMEPS